MLVGNFNPAIFSPAWLNRVGLIKDAVAEDAEVQIIHSELTVLKFGAMEIQIGPSRLTVSTPEVPFVRIQEFTTDLLGKVLPQTPIQFAGINFEEHFLAPSPKHRMALGRMLAPTKPWGEWGKKLEAGNKDTPSGLIRLVMQETKPGGREGSFSVEVGPSDEINKYQAVKVKTNDHFEVEETKFATSAEVTANTLADEFDRSHRKAFGMFSHIRELTEGAVT